jgi:hypothetical protein
MSEQPWSFDEAVHRCSLVSKRQQEAEAALKSAYVGFAEAQEAYARRLAQVVESLREMSVPATVCLELARGAEDVAALRRERDGWEGVKAAAEQACWRRNADRKDAQRFSDWSQRREFAEAAGEVQHTFEKPIGVRA